MTVHVFELDTSNEFKTGVQHIRHIVSEYFLRKQSIDMVQPQDKSALYSVEPVKVSCTVGSL